MTFFSAATRGMPILKRLYPSIRKRLARHFWRDGYRIVSSRGALFLVDYRNYVDRQIAFYGDYESKQVACLTEAMRTRGCDLFLDVGANIGLYSVRVARAACPRRILAFEPDPRNLHQLGANLLINGLTDRVEIVAKAVSDRAGSVPFRFYPPGSTGQSRIDADGAATRVDAVRIDDLVELGGGVVFAKIDVEGHEAAAIGGMTATIRANSVFLQVESFPDRFAQLSESLSGLGLHHLHSIGDDHYFANF